PGNVVATDVNPSVTLTYGIVGETPDISQPGFNESATGSFGTLFLNSATGAFTFIPNDAAINALTTPTTQSFTLTVSDGTNTTTSLLNINIAGANDAPTLQPVPGQSITDTGVNSFTPLTGQLVGADVDLPPQTLAYGIIGGTSTSFTSGSVTYDVAENSTFGTLAVNSATGQYIFVPNDAAIKALSATTTTESFTFTVSDGSLSAQQTLTITINGADDAPVGVNDVGTATEAGGTSNGTPGANATGNVLTNDTDVDNPTTSLSVSAIRTGPTESSGTAGTVSTALTGAHGALTLNTD